MLGGRATENDDEKKEIPLSKISFFPKYVYRNSNKKKRREKCGFKTATAGFWRGSFFVPETKTNFESVPFSVDKSGENLRTAQNKAFLIFQNQKNLPPLPKKPPLQKNASRFGFGLLFQFF